MMLFFERFIADNGSSLLLSLLPGDRQHSDPVCPSAKEETERLLYCAFSAASASEVGGSGGGGNDEWSSLASLREGLPGDDDRQALLEALVLAGVISSDSV